MKKILTILIFLPIILTTQILSAERKAQIIFEGKKVKSLNIYKFNRDDFFPIKPLAEVYGASVVWHPVTGKVSLNMNNNKFDIYIKSTKYIAKNKIKRISQPTRYINEDVYVPTELILSKDFENFTNTSTEYNPDTCILTIERKLNILTPRFYSQDNTTKIVIELMEDLKYQWVEKDKGNIYISFIRGLIAKEDIDINDGIIKNIKTKTDNRCAIVEIFTQSDNLKIKKEFLSNPNRLVITFTKPEVDIETVFETIISSRIAKTEGFDVSSSSNSLEEVSKKDESIILASSTVNNSSVNIKPLNINKKVIVLDAGHGGEDPGAIGRNGLKEKDINLSIVFELKRLLEETGEYEVLLTRTDDTFIPLVDRTLLANEKKADLFISVHCNASMKKDSKGFEIYFLSENATDMEAQATAALENSVVQLEKKPIKNKEKLQELLWSMVVNEFINESSELCSLIAKQVSKRIDVENRGVKQAGFYVLRGAQMPSVLVECAFISNIEEEAKLKSRRFQKKMADAIFEGITNFSLRKNNKNSMNAHLNKG